MDSTRSSLMLSDVHQGDEIDWIVDDRSKQVVRLCLDWVPLVKLSFDQVGFQFKKLCTRQAIPVDLKFVSIVTLFLAHHKSLTM